MDDDTAIQNNPRDPEDAANFSVAERDRRWSVAREFMCREGLDGLLVYGEHEDAGPAPFSCDAWFTNARAGTTVLITREGGPVSLLPMEMYWRDYLEDERRDHLNWIPPENLRMSRDSSAIVDAVADMRLTTARIGVIGLEPAAPWHPEGVIPYRQWRAVLERLPDVKFVPVGQAFALVLMPLGAEEIRAVRRAADVGDAMARAMVEAAGAGVRESEVYAAGMAAGYARGTAPAAMHFRSGPDPLARGLPPWSHRPEAPRILTDGDVVSAEVFAHAGGRHTQHQVTIAVGEPHPDLARAAAVARDAYDAALRTLRPGNSFGDVVASIRAVLTAAAGWEFGPALHALNPPIALSGFPAVDRRRIPGAERYPVERDHPTVGADIELAPGMTFALEPNYVFGRRLAYLGGTVIVGESDPTELNPYIARLLRAGQPKG